MLVRFVSNPGGHRRAERPKFLSRPRMQSYKAVQANFVPSQGLYPCPYPCPLLVVSTILPSKPLTLGAVAATAVPPCGAAARVNAVTCNRWPKPGNHPKGYYYYYHPHFMDEETETHKDQATCTRSRNRQLADLGIISTSGRHQSPGFLPLREVPVRMGYSYR